MTTITYTTLTTLVHDTTTLAATAEAIIDQAVNAINAYGADLPNMTGTAGSKTLSCESNEAGWILAVAVEIYTQYYKSAGSTSSSYGIGGLNFSQSSSGGAGATGIYALAKQAARALLAIEAEVT